MLEVLGQWLNAYEKFTKMEQYMELDFKVKV